MAQGQEEEGGNGSLKSEKSARRDGKLEADGVPMGMTTVNRRVGYCQN